MSDKDQENNIDITSGKDLNVGGDVVGGDKTTSNITSHTQIAEGGPVARIAVLGIIAIAVLVILVFSLRNPQAVSTPTSALFLSPTSPEATGLLSPLPAAQTLSLSPTMTLPSPTATAPLSISAQLTFAPANLIFREACVPADLWIPYLEAGSILPAEDQCWPNQLLVDNWGMYGKDNGLKILLRPDLGDMVHGIYYPLKGSRIVVEFKINISEIFGPNERLVNIGFGIISTNPAAPLTEGLFYQKEKFDQPVVLKRRETGTTAEYLYKADQLLRLYQLKTTQTIVFSVDGPELSISIDAEPVIESVRIPLSERAFWIGYRVPNGGQLNATLSDFKIEKK